jgi:hypothetical protein
MKALLTTRLALTGAAALLTHTALAQTWHNVDDFQYLAGQDATATAITRDAAGNLYAAGWGVVDVNYDSHALVMKSTDGGTNWSAIDDFSNGDPYPGWGYNAIAAGPAGQLYAVGDDWPDASNLSGWFVRGSQDGGSTWSTMDRFTRGSPSAAYGVATDSAGSVYVVGDAPIANPAWIVRKGTPNGSGGLVWATVDTFAAGGSGRAYGVLCHPTAGTFVVGYAGNAGPRHNQMAWYVRRSLNGGVTWATVNTYVGGWATGIGADASGHLYVVGAGWIVRKSNIGGTSWATVDHFVPASGSSWARGFTADSHGNLFVVGGIDYSSKWIVRENPSGVSNWQTVDTYIPGGATTPYGAVADNLGHVFVAGYSLSNGAHWLVRKN